MKMSIGGLVVAMPEQVRSCANILIASGAHIGCLMRKDEPMQKLFAPMFPDGFAAEPMRIA
ncbi:hypothetical protein [Bradyrhizobium sp. SHOUNA76]|uniref:hypothetical protein n=1 Tax=Bradyrhizobium sp. SHOUNA76 TaxID=2908927 RepID=UPI001FF59B6F|nr:hypothetical protein [Bradyrhizobium sp. SHOUNA76]MCJ9703865.1 hypothetical protein [Bradyrhizobium sp. SHOUNA76]